MRILLLGSGGREHAFAWKLTQSPLCESLFIAPGNPGTAKCGTNLPFSVTDFDAIKQTCIDKKIDLVIVGPEEPLVKGVTDFIISNPALRNIDVIGPGKNGAQLEGSKAFAKAFMMRHNIPTAAYKEFTLENYQEGVSYLKNHALPIVMKADGLAAGKGVVICENHLEAIAEFELMIQRAKFGEAGKRVVIEQFLQGVEMSVFVLMDGKNYVILPEAKDYKRIGEGDTGPNTGGMGAVSPVPFADKVLMKKIEEKVIKPTVDGLQKEGLEYRGFIFFGFMIVKDEPYMIEYNCRMGDPETEVVIPRLKNDLVELFAAVATQQLDKIKIETDPRTACTVVAVSGGYPGEYEKGHIINGLDDINPTDSMLFHMGTTEEKGKIVTSGGRVFCITSYGKSVFDAVEISKDELRKVSFTEMNYRTDIGYEFP
ncbi:MAG: phosphoribosylamine--glycine ligase [Chitinophagaceae bacterium]|nr:phosphoribosylamine--glycine ligase [Chitinophagaceae bacterium]MBK7678479.1 phosphoribosylamine--glycine ligase [Chitinophagaceae bacterium]MBK9464212.1 phosphoribosylamine--glycine ligase [Chitinophagaceae bacterium]MBL0067114.1 phosphoribosylamine--glycine ligase [Chitinophagaceae bacterium]MBP6232060.1 phosphoribosylamine--glycine ligase [Chitinophagaceae bacterium]